MGYAIYFIVDCPTDPIGLVREFIFCGNSYISLGCRISATLVLAAGRDFLALLGDGRLSLLGGRLNLVALEKG